MNRHTNKWGWMGQEIDDLLEVFENKYVKHIIALLIVVGILFAAMYGYRAWSINRLRKAQNALSECMREWYDAQIGAAPWSSVQNLAHDGYKNHGSTNLGGYFLAMEAQSLARQKMYTQAVETMEQAVAQLNSSPMVNGFKIARALMKLDSDSETAHVQALEELALLARSKDQYGADEAAYRLGTICLAQGDVSKTREYWTMLSEQTFASKEEESPWVALAKNRLEQLPS
jgi:hypothetical protein